MDAVRFDQFVRTLGARESRRGLLGWLIAVLLSSPFVALPREVAEARGRRKRRRRRFRHGQNRPKNRRKHKKHKKKQTCKARSRARICAGTCGIVRNKKTCKKAVDCGSCSCHPLCPSCQVCDETVDVCQPDPATVGDPCGEAGQVCQSDGTCACDAGRCGGVCGCESGFLCDDGDCVPCDVIHNGDNVASGQALQNRVMTGGAIRVCPGRYQHNFVLSANVDLIGAGDGENEASSTILDAAGSGRPLTVNENVTASLQRVRLTGGHERLGGGVRSNGELTMTACAVTGNAASLGGGLYLSFSGSGPLALVDCQVTRNTASTDGGGIHINSIFTTTLSGCTVSENQSTNHGGGIYNNGRDVEFTGSEISENEAANNGGGVYNATPVSGDPGDATFDAASRITNNSAGTDGVGTGGGIFNEGTVALNGAAVNGNEPDNCAGDPVDGCVEES